MRTVTTSIQLSQAACMSSFITKTTYFEDHSRLGTEATVEQISFLVHIATTDL